MRLSFWRGEDLDQAAGGHLKAYIREAIAKAQGK